MCTCVNVKDFHRLVVVPVVLLNSGPVERGGNGAIIPQSLAELEANLDPSIDLIAKSF